MVETLLAVQHRVDAFVRQFIHQTRKRLFFSLGSLMLGAGLSAYFYKQIIAAILVPAHGLLSTTGLPVYTEATEVMGIVIKLTTFGGLAFMVPVLAYQIVLFIAPWLKPPERRLALAFVPVAFVCFVTGACFAYFVMLPAGLKFLLTFGEGIAQPMIRIGSFVSLVLTLVFWVGVLFELPLLMFLLARLRIVPFRVFRKWSKHTFFAAFILGALITPTFDPINQTLIAVPIIALYHIGLVLAWLARPRG